MEMPSSEETSIQALKQDEEDAATGKMYEVSRCQQFSSAFVRRDDVSCLR